MVFNKHNDVNVIKKATDCLNYIVMIIINMGLSGKDDNWEKVMIDSLLLIEVT